MFPELFSAVVANADGPAVGSGILAEEGLLLLGDDFLPWIILAFGAAMVVGNVLALVRPPAPKAGEDATQSGPPIARASVMIVIGAIAAIWGIASLLS